MWTDTHCHLQYEGIPEDAVERARTARVGRFVCVGTDFEQSQRAIEIAATSDDIVATVGLHPHDAKNGLAPLEPLLDSAGVVAIGECGLDYHYDHSPREVQREVFAQQVDWALRRDLALVIHTRNAWDDTFAILRDVGTPERTVFHCFTGDAEEARQCLDLGATLSFSGIVTFKNADDIRRAVALCPLDRMVVETDAPYLTPEPHRGAPNEPAFVPFVGQRVADEKGLAREVVEEATWRNAGKIFRFDD